MLDKVFLDEVAKNKLLIVSTLEKEWTEPISIHRFTQFCPFSYTKIQSFLLDISSELLELFEFDLIVDGKLVFDHEKFSINKYQHYLFHGSLAYDFLLTILMRPKTSFQEFCQKHYLSGSSCARRMSPVKKYLKKYQIALNIHQMKITGSEALVRIFYHTILLRGSLEGQAFLLDEEFSEELDVVKKIDLDFSDFIHLEEIMAILMISKQRTMQGYLLQETPFDSLILPKEAVYIEEYLRSFIEDAEQIQRNVELTVYFIFYYPYYYTTDDPRMNQLKCYYERMKEVKHESYLFHKELQKFYLDEIISADQPQTDLDLLKGNTYTTILNFLIQKNSLPLLLSVIETTDIEKEEKYQEVYSLVYAFLNKMSKRISFEWTKECLREFSAILTLNLLPHYSTTSNVSLVVGLPPQPNYLLQMKLIDYLEQINFVIIRFCSTDMPEIDVFITTYENLLPETQKPFYLVDQTQLNLPDFDPKLFSFLSNEYIRKQTEANISVT